MPFHFSLGALLRVRESQEKAELQRLQFCAAQVVQVRVEIDSLDADTDAARRQLLEQVTAGVSGAELQMAAISETLRQQARTSLLAKLEELERARKKQQLRYTSVRQTREIFSNLRKRYLSAYRLEESRRAQQQIDELFLIRRGAGAGNAIGGLDGDSEQQ
jgi:flagellar export protein FliJ